MILNNIETIIIKSIYNNGKINYEKELYIYIVRFKGQDQLVMMTE